MKAVRRARQSTEILFLESGNQFEFNVAMIIGDIKSAWQLSEIVYPSEPWLSR